MTKEDVVAVVLEELETAQKNFPAMLSPHEGMAVFFEEVCELWEAVRMKQSSPHRLDKMREEGIQVAAMALRFLLDVCK